MTSSSSLAYYQHGRNSNYPLPTDLMIQIFIYLSPQPQDLLNCALTTRRWTLLALQELYRHPWGYLYFYQFETEGQVMDKYGSMLLLRTLFQGCLDPSRVAFPYASFARSVNLKWVHDTFDLPEVSIQKLIGSRWTRNEAPKEFLIRHLLADRPYLSDYIHCHTPRLPRCLFSNTHANNTANDIFNENTSTTTLTTEGPLFEASQANASNTTNTADTDSGDLENMMQHITDLTAFDPQLLATPPLLPVHQPIATAMPFVYPVATNSSSGSPPSKLISEHHVTHISLAPAVHSIGIQMVAELADDIPEAGKKTDNIDSTISEVNNVQVQPVTQPISSIPDEAPKSGDSQQPLVPTFVPNYPHATNSSSQGSSSRPFLNSWPLTMEQTQSLVFLDLRHAVITDNFVASLSLSCQKIEFLKVATSWQNFSNSYSVTDLALTQLVTAQKALKLVHVENHREVCQGHQLVNTIDALAKFHGSTLETLVLSSHDFQKCNLGDLGKSCQKLIKFAAPGGSHLYFEQVTKLTDACKLTLEHLDFSNSDIDTDTVMTIMKGASSPPAAKGVLKALILLGMEDTLNSETCLAIGEHGPGLECFRLDILESEAIDIGRMLAHPSAMNLRVLTIGCHDIHGDLANDILEQIALNCRNVELLDINHWQFSAQAIEGVLRECGMLRYLNVSSTDISESTADVICRCLGEIKEIFTPIRRISDDSLYTPLSFRTFSTSQLQTPAPVHQWHGVVLDSSHTQENVETEGEATKSRDEDRSGIEASTYPIKGIAKKQSQIGLVHHYSNAMDLRTIMNLDLDKAIEMEISFSVDEDTDMNLGYHHKNSYNNSNSDNDDSTVRRDEDIEMMDENEDEDEVGRPTEPKGKEAYVEDGVSSISTATAPASSSSYGSTSSSSSSETQNGQVQLLTAEAGGSVSCTPLLPSLPIPSRQGEDFDADSIAISTSTSNDQVIPILSPILEIEFDHSKDFDDLVSSDSLATPSHLTTTDLVPETDTTENEDSTPAYELMARRRLVQELESEEYLSKSLAWTKNSRLEQVNVECCTLLSAVTINKIKVLSSERQLRLAIQGRKRSRTWVENEHDMMMTRLEVERGPQITFVTPSTSDNVGNEDVTDGNRKLEQEVLA
ncbi:hypothetical protein BGZ46_007567 [Entomortierella lignicola]|nr:hypothetical protein BGZ46_007567 [Entomortierella lignicola]